MCFIYIYFLLLCSTLCQNRIEKFTEQPNQTSQAKKEHKKIYIENKNNNYAVYLTYINIVFFLLLFVLFLLLFGTFPNIQGVPDGKKKLITRLSGYQFNLGYPVYMYTQIRNIWRCSMYVVRDDNSPVIFSRNPFFGINMFSIRSTFCIVITSYYCKFVFYLHFQFILSFNILYHIYKFPINILLITSIFEFNVLCWVGDKSYCLVEMCRLLKQDSFNYQIRMQSGGHYGSLFRY